MREEGERETHLVDVLGPDVLEDDLRALERAARDGERLLERVLDVLDVLGDAIEVLVLAWHRQELCERAREQVSSSAHEDSTNRRSDAPSPSYSSLISSSRSATSGAELSSLRMPLDLKSSARSASVLSLTSTSSNDCVT